MKRWTIMSIAATLTIGAVSAATIANDTEQPDYSIVAKDGAIELRQYEPMIVAEATVSGSRGVAINRGFRIIADYIFGNNISSQKVAMTSPVTQQAVGEKIAMTSPVTQQQDGEAWNVRFIMPSEYTMDTLPVPNNPRVRLLEEPGKRVAAIRFSGRASTRDLQKQAAKLRQYISANELQPIAEPTFAFYDGPGVPWALRRNEVMIEIAAE